MIGGTINEWRNRGFNKMNGWLENKMIWWIQTKLIDDWRKETKRMDIWKNAMMNEKNKMNGWIEEQ